MMGGSGSMTFGDVAPFVIGIGVIVVAIVVFFIIRAFRRG
jgi:hypothetical protein